jgi:choline dehydrogenase
MEDRLGIAPWTIAPNANNAALARGAAKLGIESAAIRRNVAAAGTSATAAWAARPTRSSRCS